MPPPKALDEDIKKKSVLDEAFAQKIDDRGDSNPEGPLGEATETALAALAEFVLNSDLTSASTQAIQAIEMQKLGEHESAVAAFQRAESGGVRYPPIYMCLATLSLKLGKYPEALKYFEKVQKDDAFAGGAAHGI